MRAAEFPPGDRADLVIAPAHPIGRGMFELEARSTADGGSMLPIFSTVALLVEQLGAFQPWVALPITQVQRLATGAGVSSVLLDPELEPGLREWSEDDIREFNELRRSGE